MAFPAAIATKRAMTELANDFLRGLVRIIEDRKDLSVTSVAVKAGLDNSTLRKLIAANALNPRMETCVKLAGVTGYSYDAIVALGRSERHSDILDVVSIYEGLSPERQQEAAEFLRFLANRPLPSSENGS